MVSCLCFESISTQRMLSETSLFSIVLMYTRGRVSDLVSLASVFIHTLSRMTSEDV